jgi:hypothetical protein
MLQLYVFLMFAELLAHPFLNPTAVLQQQQQLLAQHLATPVASLAPAAVDTDVQRKQIQSLLEQIALLTGQKQLTSETVLEVLNR